MKTQRDSWVGQLAATMHEAYLGSVPRPVLDRAGLQLFDAIACAAGALDAEPVRIIHAAVRGSGPPDAALLFRGEPANLADAVLVNGAAVRYLDFNDAFIGSGPGGHPSDNIPVALAIGERERSSGHQILTAIALGYELFWRLRQNVYGKAAASAAWDGTSVSGAVSALISGLLLGLDEAQLANALAIGAVKGYGLKQVRRGSISTMKACGNALVAREGTLAGLLAKEGLTGPAEVFEGKSGLLRAFGLEPTAALHDTLMAPPEWAIQNISIKLYPAIATSQAAVHGGILISRNQPLDTSGIESVTLRLPESKATREHLGIKQRLRPDSRETADHSMPFLLACALEDGALSHEQFEGARWTRPSTLALMERITIVPDEQLAAQAGRCYPASVEVVMQSGDTYREDVIPTPGSPDRPWGIDDIAGKFAGIQRIGIDAPGIGAIGEEVSRLPDATDLHALLALVGPAANVGFRAGATAEPHDRDRTLSNHSATPRGGR